MPKPPRWLNYQPNRAFQPTSRRCAADFHRDPYQGDRQEGGQPDAHSAANRHGHEQLWLRDMPLLTLKGTEEISLKERRRL